VEGGVEVDVERRVAIGRACRRLIDYGRLQFLRRLGFRAEVVYYCHTELTPENVLLIAWREGGEAAAGGEGADEEAAPGHRPPEAPPVSEDHE
jgi:hypothetical protein